MPVIDKNFVKIQMGNLSLKCGNKFKSSTKSQDGTKRSDSSRERQSSNDIFSNWADDQELQLIRKTIENAPELFILNNLMMSIQFFENYDEEIANIRQTLVSAREVDLNKRLPPQKHVLIPDVLQEQVSKNIDFTYVRPTLIPSVEPLQPIRIYLVFDNIEVTEQNFASPYSSVNEDVIYSMQLKPSKHPGYALLQRLEVNPSKKKPDPNDEDLYSDGDSLYSDNKINPEINSLTGHNPKLSNSKSTSNLRLSSNVNDEYSTYDERENIYDIKKKNSDKGKSIVNKKNNIKNRKNIVTHVGDETSPGGSTSSGYRSNYIIDSDSDGGYALSTRYGGSKNSIENDINNKELNCEIPRNCFQIYDPRKEKRQKLYNKDKMIKNVIYNRIYDVWYLNSSKFMDYFYELFIEKLSKIMDFDDDNKNEPHGAIIFRNKIEALEKNMGLKDEQFEIIPCIWTSWPDIAYEWLNRQRSTWPDYDVIEKIKEIGCHIIPNGFYDENITNNLRNLEWELTFPAAERYLETCLSYSQIRVYFISLMLHKTFIRPIDFNTGLTASHIRNQLFWLIEENDTPSKWIDSRLGECLMKLLNSLYRSISQDIPVMPDYFVKDKNIFQGKIYLLRTQKQLKRIIENPIMYVLHAIQNIRHSRSFFPKLDYTFLLKILTEDTLTLISPHLLVNQPAKPLTKNSSNNNNINSNVNNNGINDKDYEPVNGFWNSAKQRKEHILRKPVTNKTLIDAKRSYDQVIEITVRCAELETRRLCLLLDFFIRHFIKIAECCHKYNALTQKNIYIEQAERLTVLLSEHSAHKDDAKVYIDKLHHLKRRINTSNNLPQNIPPVAPKRNLDRPIFSSSLKDRYQNTNESQQNFVHINRPGETKEYSINNSNEDYTSNLTSTSPKKHVTMAVVHEIDIINSDKKDYISTDDIKNNKPLVVSLEKNTDESLLDTTYI